MTIGANHPWRRWGAAEQKLKAARKEAKRIYERTSPVRNDEFYKLMNREKALKHHRRKAGIPTDLPKMKPWDYSKGRVGKKGTSA